MLICYPVNQTGDNTPKSSSKKTVAIIPARYASTRLPGKALIEINGKPMVCWVAERAQAARNVDRVAEVAAKIPDAEIIVNVQGDEPLISPETIEKAVDTMAGEMSKSNGAGIVTTCEPIESLEQLLNFNLVKVVVDENGDAVYFSRSPIPFPSDAAKRHGGDPERALEEEPELFKIFRKHTGLYVYRRDVLMEFTSWPPAKLEMIEALEQL